VGSMGARRLSPLSTALWQMQASNRHIY